MNIPSSFLGMEVRLSFSWPNYSITWLFSWFLFLFPDQTSSCCPMDIPGWQTKVKLRVR